MRDTRLELATTPAAAHATGVERTPGFDAPGGLPERLREVALARAPGVGQVEVRRTDGGLAIVIRLDVRLGRRRQGRLLAELARQGQLVPLLRPQFAEATGLDVDVDAAPTHTLRLVVPDAPSTELVDRVAGALDGLLESIAHGRSDRLLRPWTGRPAPAREPYVEHDVDDRAASAPPPTVDAEIRLVEQASPGQLARLDDSLLTFDDDEAEAVGTLLGAVLEPFEGGVSILHIGGHRVGVREVVATAARPAAGVAVRDGGLAVEWLLEQVLAQVREHGVPPGVAVRVRRIGPGSASAVAEPQDPVAQRVVAVMPGARPADVVPQRNDIVIDLFGVLAPRVHAGGLAHNVLSIAGASVRAGDDAIALSHLSGPGHRVRPALVEAVLMLLDDTQAGLGDREEFDALARRHRLQVNVLWGLDGAIGSPQWQAHQERRELGRHDDEEAHDATAWQPPVGQVGSAPFNLCERVFDPAHLRSDARVIDPATGESLRYAELQRHVYAHTGRLQALGIGPGDIVGFAASDGLAATAVMLACLACGAVFAPLSPAASEAQYAAMFDAARPRLVLVDAATAGQRKALMSRWPQRDLEAFLQLPLAGTPAPKRLPPDAPGVMLFTSGSTGRPKAVLHTHADFVTCSLNYGRCVLELGPADCLYTPSRLFFAYGLNNLMLSLLAGASHVLAVPLPGGQGVGDVIETQGVTVFMAVPTVYKLALTRAQRPLRAPALRLCVSAGERMSARLHRQARDHLGVDVLDGIGCTEALSTFISNRPGWSVPGCTGTVVPGFQVRLVDERGEPCRVGAVGELWVKGNTLARRYASDEGGGEAFVDGWFNTQDLFFADAAGRFYNVGRAGSVIKINACWFSPDTLEATLQAHPAVRDCAVCVVQDDYGMPRPKAFVVVDEAQAAGRETDQLWRELRELSKARLGKDHYPHFFALVGSLPRTASGKLLRHDLSTLPHFRGTNP